MQKEDFKDWDARHWKWICSEVKEAGLAFRPEDIEKILELTRFIVRSKKHPERCPGPYTETLQPCHKGIPLEDFNCFVCACPHYDNGNKEGACKIGSKKGFYYHSKTNPKIRVWDCTPCGAYHTPNTARRYLEKNLQRLRALSETL